MSKLSINGLESEGNNLGGSENRSQANVVSENRNPGSKELNENRNPPNFLSEENNPAHFALSENRIPTTYGVTENRSPPNYEAAENKSPPNYTLNESRNQTNFGPSENRNSHNFVSSENRNTSTFGLSENCPSAIGLNESRNQPSFALGESRNQPSFALGESRNQPSFALGESRNQPSFALGESRNQPSFALGESRNQPSFALGESRNQPSFALGESRNQPSFPLGESRNQPSFSLGESRNPLNFMLNEDQSSSNFGVNQDRRKPNFRLNGNRNPPNFGYDRNMSNFGLDRNPSNFAFNEGRNQTNYSLSDKRNLQNYGLSPNRSVGNFVPSEDRNQTNVGSIENRNLANFVLSNDRSNPASFSLNEDITSICQSCQIGLLAFYKCFLCRVSLCCNCVEQHTKQLPAQNHALYKIVSGSVKCMNHPELEASNFCKLCNMAICSQCSVCDHNQHDVVILKEYLRNSKEQLVLLETDVNVGRETILRGKRKLEAEMESLKLTKENVEADIENQMSRLIQMIIAKKMELQRMAEEIYLDKMNFMEKQRLELAASLNQLCTTKQVLRNINLNEENEVLTMAQSIAADVKEMKASCCSVEPCEDDVMQFNYRENEILEAIENFGSVHSSGSARRTVLAGQNVHYARVLRRNTIIVHVKDHLGKPLLPELEMDNLTVKVCSSKGNCELRAEREHGRSSFKITFVPRSIGLLKIRFKLRGVDIYASPITVNVMGSRNYNIPFSNLPKVIGMEGICDGQFCRPWGVCSSGQGDIIIADRSNNRIQIFDFNCTFKLKFGSQGNDKGQFSRPAGIAWDSYYNRIVVSDKDNHRIQIFDMNGEYITQFGEKGVRNGSFHYPWDVAVNEQAMIIVTDTRNHRIQLFSPEGQFITKFGSEVNNSMWKYFDSPRGVCFDPEGKVIITDFNHHRVGILSNRLQDDRWLGSEGDMSVCYNPRELKFLRPQGVAADADGNIIVSDSRNSRIVVFNQVGNIIRIYVTNDETCGGLDRPSGICITPDGRILVVDFGHNRIVII